LISLKIRSPSTHKLTLDRPLGVLRKAKFKGQIEKVKPVLDQLREDTGFRIHQKLYEEILKDVGER
jgi:predicted nucleic acid-binding protein